LEGMEREPKVIIILIVGKNISNESDRSAENGTYKKILKILSKIGLRGIPLSARSFSRKALNVF
jgi:hypothetical protein